MDGIDSGIAHLQAELSLLDLLLQRQVLRLRAAQQLSDDEFRGLYISDAQVDRLLARRDALSRTGMVELEGFSAEELTAQIELLRCEIDLAVEAGVHAGRRFPLRELATCFQLSSFETAVVLIAVAPELSLQYQTLYAYVQNDVTRKHPCVDLCLSLYCRSHSERWNRHTAFLETEKVFQHRLLRWVNDSQDRDPPLLARALKAEERIVAFLLDQPALDQRLAGSAHLIEAAQTFEQLHFPAELLGQIRHAARHPADDGPIFVFNGPAGAGKQSLAEAVCAVRGHPLLAADAEQFFQEDTSFESWISMLRRECLLSGSGLYLGRFERLMEEEKPSRQYLGVLARRLSRAPFPIFIGSSSRWRPVGELWRSQPAFVFDLSLPNFDQRLELWRHFTENGHSTQHSVDYEALANKFVLSPGQIRDAASHARHLSWKRPPEDRQPCLDDFYQAARFHSNHRLERLAQKVEPRYRWEDIVLPSRSMRQLHEIHLSVKHRHVVYGTWKFDEKLFLGKGLNVLFSGPSGTGKTMAASIIAKELKLDLYKIDLANVVSKYIGETEKNLDHIFTEARSSNAILFFDEADALFGKRSEVKDAHDRYANIEVAYLLQKMEEYEGICILATNLKNNLDDAFARRMHHAIEFPFPEVSHRLKIWRGMFPVSAPVAEDIDWNFLARQFELSGGNIRNVALSAGFLAAEAERPISMEHVVLGIARELKKSGCLPSQAAFRQYYELIRESS
jgi:hypothetical protein